MEGVREEPGGEKRGRKKKRSLGRVDGFENELRSLLKPRTSSSAGSYSCCPWSCHPGVEGPLVTPEHPQDAPCRPTRPCLHPLGSQHQRCTMKPPSHLHPLAYHCRELVKKFIWVFRKTEWKNWNELLPNPVHSLHGL